MLRAKQGLLIQSPLSDEHLRDGGCDWVQESSKVPSAIRTRQPGANLAHALA